MTALAFEERQIGDHPSATIIWLHGLGADGFDFATIPEQLALPQELSIRFLFPHAPVQAVSLNQGMEMNAWYDIYELSFDAKEDQAGIFAAMHAVEDLITTQCSDFEPDKIILVGFSQGGGVALQTLLHGKVSLGGVIALSTYLPLRALAHQADPNRIKDIPLLMMHGLHDDVLAYSVGEMSKNLLADIGVAIDWHAYAMAHSLCAEQLSDISRWLCQRLK